MAAGAGWDKVNGFLDGLGGAVGAVGGIVDTGADIAEDVARGKAAISNQNLDKQSREIDLALRMQGFQRGDNKLVILAVAAAAVALIMLSR